MHRNPLIIRSKYMQASICFSPLSLLLKVRLFPCLSGEQGWESRANHSIFQLASSQNMISRFTVLSCCSGRTPREGKKQISTVGILGAHTWSSLQVEFLGRLVFYLKVSLTLHSFKNITRCVFMPLVSVR